MNAPRDLATKGAIRMQNVDKVYYAREGAVQAVSDCSLDIRAGEICMIVGPSGQPRFSAMSSGLMLS